MFFARESRLTVEADSHSIFGEIAIFRTKDGHIGSIHRNLVEEQSGYFKAKLVAQDAVILGTEAIEVKINKNIWTFYAQWLYGKAITSDSMPDGWNIDLYFLTLVALHKAGEVLQDALFQDEIMNTIIKLIKEASRESLDEEDIERFHLDFVLSEVLCPGASTPEVRYLMADYVVFCCSAFCGPEVEGCLKAARDPGFSSAVTQALLSKLLGKCTAPPWEHACEYHKHGDDERCMLELDAIGGGSKIARLTS